MHRGPAVHRLDLMRKILGVGERRRFGRTMAGLFAGPCGITSAVRLSGVLVSSGQRTE